jgi:hypothetical protein
LEFPSEVTRRNKPASIDLASAIEADDRFARSPAGMLRTAKGLRDRASQMTDCRDRDVMLRMADEFEGRAEDLERDSKNSIVTKTRGIESAKRQRCQQGRGRRKSRKALRPSRQPTH